MAPCAYALPPAPVLGSDGELVGRLAGVEPGGLVVERGPGPALVIPGEAVRDDRGDVIVLAVPAERANAADRAGPLLPPADAGT
jgi:hypothetical protein